MTDAAQRAAERIATEFWDDSVAIFRPGAKGREFIAAIIRDECFPVVGAEPIRNFAASQAIDRDREQQARIKELEAVLAKVREECEAMKDVPPAAKDDYDLAWHDAMELAGRRVLAILNESGEAAGGSE